MRFKISFEREISEESLRRYFPNFNECDYEQPEVFFENYVMYDEFLDGDNIEVERLD